MSYVSLCMSVCEHAHMSVNVCGDQKKVLDAPELELQVVASFPVSMLGAGSSVRAAYTFNF